MKIAYIGQKRVPSREGGIEKTVEKQALRLAARGHEVILYNRSGHNIFGSQYDSTAEWPDRTGNTDTAADVSADDLSRRLQVRTVFTPAGFAGVPVYSFLATVRALREHCDVLFYHGSGSCLMIPVAKLFGAKCAAMLHGIDSQRAKWKGFGRAYLRMGEKAAAARADVCFVLSENMRSYIRKTYGTGSQVIWNGAETIGLPADPYKEGAGLRQFGLEKDGYILSLVRIVPEKGIHYLIRAFRECRTDKKLVIAGGVDPACRGYYEKLQSLAAGDPRILFTGYVQDPVVSELYRNASVFVLPSDLEGMAHSLLEAMAAGCCCLVSDIPENSSVLGEHGATFRKGDPEDLRNTLQELLDDPEKAARYREGAASYILERYSWDSCVDQIEAVFHAI